MTGRATWIRSRACGGAALAAAMASAALAGLSSGCTTVNPGPNFVVPEEHFDEDAFYCHVEPEYLFAKSCGSGDPSKGDPPNGCHFNAAAVSGMALLEHPAIDCGGGDHPVSRAALGAGSPAAQNLQAASLEMSRDYRTAPLYVRPLGANHPRAVIASDDPAVLALKTWAELP